MERKNALSCVEVEYRKLLKKELTKAIDNGEPDRAAAFSRELAKLRRKELRLLAAGVRGREAIDA